MHQSTGETCSVCEQKKEQGIYIIDFYICNNCEREIVNSEVNDEFYQYYLQKLRKLNKTLIKIP